MRDKLAPAPALLTVASEESSHTCVLQWLPQHALQPQQQQVDKDDNSLLNFKLFEVDMKMC